MGWDRRVSWKPGEVMPSLEELRLTLEGYLGDLGVIETLGHHNSMQALFIANYRDGGNCVGSFPFHHVTSVPEDFRSAQQRHFVSRERWFEVTLDDEEVVITTRQQDEFTNVVATGYATLVARFWHGELDPGG